MLRVAGDENQSGSWNMTIKFEGIEGKHSLRPHLQPNCLQAWSETKQEKTIHNLLNAQTTSEILYCTNRVKHGTGNYQEAAENIEPLGVLK